MTTAQLLKQSMAAHERSLMQRRQKTGDWRASMQDAYDLRVQAHEADPEHTDQAWSDENVKTNTSADTHTQLMAFYRKQLNLL